MRISPEKLRGLILLGSNEKFEKKLTNHYESENCLVLARDYAYNADIEREKIRNKA